MRVDKDNEWCSLSLCLPNFSWPWLFLEPPLSIAIFGQLIYECVPIPISIFPPPPRSSSLPQLNHVITKGRYNKSHNLPVTIPHCLPVTHFKVHLAKYTDCVNLILSWNTRSVHRPTLYTFCTHGVGVGKTSHLGSNSQSASSSSSSKSATVMLNVHPVDSLSV